MIFHFYLARQLAQALAGILLAGMLVIAASRLLQYMQSALEGKLEVLAAVTAVGLRLPEFVLLFLPLAWVFGAWLVLTRLWADNEMVAAHFAFVSPRQIKLNLFASGLLVAGVTLALSIWIAPAAALKAERVLFESRTKSALLLLDPGIFHRLDNGWMLNVSGREGESLGQHLLLRQHSGGRVELVWGERLDATPCAPGDDCALLLDWPESFRYADFSADGVLRDTASLEELSTPLMEPLPSAGKRPVGVALAADTPLAVQVEWHLSLPLYCLIMLFMVLPLAQVLPRQSRFRNLPLLLLLALVYLTWLAGAREALLRTGGDAAAGQQLGTWGVHLVFASIALLVVPAVSQLLRWLRRRSAVLPAASGGGAA